MVAAIRALKSFARNWHDLRLQAALHLSGMGILMPVLIATPF